MEIKNATPHVQSDAYACTIIKHLGLGKVNLITYRIFYNKQCSVITRLYLIYHINNTFMLIKSWNAILKKHRLSIAGWNCVAKNMSWGRKCPMNAFSLFIKSNSMYLKYFPSEPWKLNRKDIFQKNNFMITSTTWIIHWTSTGSWW